jgi:hypothetical protein
MKVFATAPLWLRESLIFPYLGGAEFVCWFEHQYPGKQPYGALMPISTEQILHPARYLAGDRPDGLAFTTSDAVRYEDGLGEFEIRLLFEQFLRDDSAAVASAAGWDGDRYQVRAVPPPPARATAKKKGAVREQGGATGGDALVWYTLWDDAPAAARFAKALGRAWAGGSRWSVARRAGPEGARRSLCSKRGLRFLRAG